MYCRDRLLHLKRLSLIPISTRYMNGVLSRAEKRQALIIQTIFKVRVNEYAPYEIEGKYIQVRCKASYGESFSLGYRSIPVLSNPYYSAGPETESGDKLEAEATAEI